MYISGPSNASSVIKANISDLINRLDTGDVIRARVLGKSDGEIELRLSDGSVIKAAINENISVETGTTLLLRVTSNSGNRLFLEIIKGNSESVTYQSETINNILESLGITPDQKSTLLAAEFLKSGIEITPELFKNALNFINAYKGIDAEKAVFLAANDITPDNDVKFIEQLLDGNYKIGKHLDELLSHIKEILPESDKPSEPNTVSPAENNAGSTAGNLSEITGGKAEFTDKTTNISPEVSIEIENTYKAAVSDIEQGREISESLKDIYNNASVVKNNDGTSTSDESYSIESHSINESSSEVFHNNTPETSQNKSSGMPQVMEKTNAPANNEIPDKSVTISPDGSKQTLSEISSDASENINKAFDTPALNDKSVRNLAQNDADGIFENAEKTANQIAEPNISAEDNQISELKSLIEQIFIPLGKDKNDEELDLKSFHKEMGNKLDTLESVLHRMKNESFPAVDNISSSAATLENAVKALDRLSTSVHYYQLPVNLSGTNTTAEIYIMKNKNRKKRIDPGNTVLFVSLDTNRIGRIETLIYLNGKNASISLRAENEEILSFVKENINYLYKGLAGSGYKLTDVKYSVNNKASTPVQIEKLLSQLANSNYGRLDMRI